jgi:hypothetical protein
MLKKIISGGQTGVDQAALRVAREFGFEIGGWCPPNRACENGTIPDDFPLTPTPSERSPNALHIPRSLRTEWNVRDSDATLVLLPNHLLYDIGTSWTITCAEQFSKPLLVINPFSDNSATHIYEWLLSTHITILNAAGPSENTCFGIGHTTEHILRQVFSKLLNSHLQ